MRGVPDCIADCVWLAIPQPTEWQRIGDEIEPSVHWLVPESRKDVRETSKHSWLHHLPPRVSFEKVLRARVDHSERRSGFLKRLVLNRCFPKKDHAIDYAQCRAGAGRKHAFQDARRQNRIDTIQAATANLVLRKRRNKVYLGRGRFIMQNFDLQDRRQLAPRDPTAGAVRGRAGRTCLRPRPSGTSSLSESSRNRLAP